MSRLRTEHSTRLAAGSVGNYASIGLDAPGGKAVSDKSLGATSERNIGCSGNETWELRRVLQRAKCQDDYMLFHPEADALAPGMIRAAPCRAPFISRDTQEAVRALEEAPDGFRMLDFSGQGLRNLPQLAECFKNARVATVADNNLQLFPINLTALTLLQRLTVANNSISEIPDCVGRLTSLRELRAADNRIANVSAQGVERLVNLTVLDVQRNTLRELPHHLASCR